MTPEQIDELLARRARYQAAGVARTVEYFEAIIPDVDDHGHQLWLRPDGERRP